jgi:hypothetical protein
MADPPSQFLNHILAIGQILEVLKAWMAPSLLATVLELQRLDHCSWRVLDLNACDLGDSLFRFAHEFVVVKEERGRLAPPEGKRRYMFTLS